MDESSLSMIDYHRAGNGQVSGYLLYIAIKKLKETGWIIRKGYDRQQRNKLCQQAACILIARHK